MGWGGWPAGRSCGPRRRPVACTQCRAAAGQHGRLPRRRHAQRRIVEASATRSGARQSGAARSRVLPAASRAGDCCRAAGLYCARGTHHHGRVNVRWQSLQMPRRTRIQSCPASCAWRRRRPCPIIPPTRSLGHRRGSHAPSYSAAPPSLLSIRIHAEKEYLPTPMAFGRFWVTSFTETSSSAFSVT